MREKTRLQTVKDLIALERGPDELLLVNSFHMLPLYVKRGRAHIRRVLAAASGGCTTGEMEAAFPDDTALIGILREHRILVDISSQPDEPDSPDILAEKIACRPKSTIKLYLLMGESCNLECIYCLNGPKTYRKRHHEGMSTQTALLGISRCLAELAPGGTVEVGFFGGEPLLHWPAIKQVISRCESELAPANSDKKIRYHLTSNLTLTPHDLVEWVGRYNISVVCGIDGPPEIHDRCRTYHGGGPSHARSAETIGRLVRAGVHPTLRATITSANHDRLHDVAAHHTDLGAASSLFIPVRPINSDSEFFPEEILPDPEKIITAALELFGESSSGKANLFPFNDFSADIRPGTRYVVACGAPYGATYVIRPNGDIYPCIYLVGRHQYRLGNVAGGFDRRPLARMFTALHVDNREDCRKCAWRYACGGGCPVMHLARIEGRARSPRIVEYSRGITCDLSRAILTDALWRLADHHADVACKE
ncbi:MAG: radical SAM protein [Syntrophobacter sp.]